MRRAKNRERDRLNQHAREVSEDAREIGPLPAVVNPERREHGRTDPEFFHRTYFPAKYKLAFGTPHRHAIRTLADCTEQGGLFAFALMRGGGKTTLAETECLRAILYGLRRYLVFIGATDPLAARAVKRMLRQLETNKLLAEDFPEVCHPVRSLERINQRAKGQTLNGEPTRMEITDSTLILPTVAGSVSSGSVIQAFGLTGALKGLNMLAPDGEPIRPDMVVIDDAQTRASARSPTQTEERERIILDDVLGLAGPETEMAAVFLCTPVFPNDLTERFIDRDRHPEWGGVRTRMVEKMPERMDLWEGYDEHRRDCLRNGRPKREINAYYLSNRAEMDKGCVLAWPERVKKGDISGVQTAMNLYLTNPTGFKSEYQCEPEAADLGAGSKEIDPQEVVKRLNGLERYTVPASTTRITAFVDVGAELLFYSVVAWNESFGGAVIDHGTYPRQNRTVFDANDPRPSLSQVHPGLTDPQRVYAGLKALVPEVVGRKYTTAAGAEVKVDRCLIDVGWQAHAVHQFIRSSPLGPQLYASKGAARSTTLSAVGQWRTKPGERSGTHWKLTAAGQGQGRTVRFDADTWKTFTHAALTVPVGGSTGLTLWGKSAAVHECFADHLAAEASTPKVLNGDKFDKWQLLPGNRPNHWWDTLVGCAVAASVTGLEWRADGLPPEPKKAKAKKTVPPVGERRRIKPLRRSA